MTFEMPIIDERIPDAMTMRHKGNPMASSLVAPLFKFPRMLKPKMSIEVPRNTKPDSGERSGQ
jgi:hypothetical protein